MSLVTIFSAPKAFTNPHIAMIQRNAIQSWTHLPDVEVILIGEEEGLAQAAAELGVRHLSDVARNESGTPLVSSIFDLAWQNSASPLLCYVNADIVLLPDLIDAARLLSKLENFLLVGQRWDADITAPLDFSGDWAARTATFVKEKGALHLPAGSDYFLFPRACFTDMPPFAIGRAGWDNWMIYKARKEHWPTIDGTESVIIIHQNHDYSHLPDNQPHYRLPESLENKQLAGGKEITRFKLIDADRRLVNGRLEPQRFTLATLRRTIETYPLLHWNNYALTERITNMMQRIFFKLGME